MNWVLPKPSEITKSSLRKWALKQLEQGTPRQIVCDYILSNLIEEYSEEEPFAVLNVESELSRVMCDRNLEGKTLEKAGDIEKAIELYEANVADWSIGTHPYDRLRVIYSKQKRYSESIRVYRTYVKILDAYIEQGSQRGNLKGVREEFINWIQKLEKKNQTEQNPV